MLFNFNLNIGGEKLRQFFLNQWIKSEIEEVSFCRASQAAFWCLSGMSQCGQAGVYCQGHPG
jgi:hypothetical protein